MEARISLITIWTDDLIPMKEFYHNVLGFSIKNDLGEYIEFDNEGVRFALCSRKVMYDYNEDYKKQSIGQSFELAFPCKNPEEVDASYKEIISKGGIPILEPQNMPWNQRTALFADPDGNIHEIFADLK
ncbi:glyoxalase [Vulcanibacillus modesticaldus]|uniref:Glyoxalase n=1 Tax=Vulcanibacillus modesticaldus TaxID=337097 RepID=A0A1D2YW54_9BACI|nr:VOC family protein [Vulcanibacillus modesticaldus]OEF99903.1 glyoxalase [Vulcanibacillus modesticaldus]